MYTLLYPESHTHPAGGKDVKVHANLRYIFEDEMDIIRSPHNAPLNHVLKMFQGVESAVG